MSRLRVGDLEDSTHSGPEDHGHVISVQKVQF